MFDVVASTEAMDAFNFSRLHRHTHTLVLHLFCLNKIATKRKKTSTVCFICAIVCSKCNIDTAAWTAIFPSENLTLNSAEYHLYCIDFGTKKKNQTYRNELVFKVMKKHTQKPVRITSAQCICVIECVVF